MAKESETGRPFSVLELTASPKAACGDANGGCQVRVCVCVYTCVCACACVCACISTNMHIYVYICMYMSDTIRSHV